MRDYAMRPCRRPWGNGGHLGIRGTQSARSGKGRTVGIGQWRRVDVTKCLRKEETGSPQHQATFMHRVCIIVHCALSITSTTITVIVFYCIICFRRINHLVVKNHLHSSSGVRAVVSSTVLYYNFHLFLMPHLAKRFQRCGEGSYEIL
jgi:hypothetical protein